MIDDNQVVSGKSSQHMLKRELLMPTSVHCSHLLIQTQQQITKNHMPKSEAKNACIHVN